MFTLHGTKRLRDRLGPATHAEPAQATTVLGDWYGNALRWRSPVAIFVNEPTLLPVLVKLAPAKTLLERFAASTATMLDELGVAHEVILAERAAMVEVAIAETNSRSLLASMNQFALSADYYRAVVDDDDLMDLSLWLADTPCRVSGRGETVWPIEQARHRSVSS